MQTDALSPCSKEYLEFIGIPEDWRFLDKQCGRNRNQVILYLSLGVTPLLLALCSHIPELSLLEGFDFTWA